MVVNVFPATTIKIGWDCNKLFSWKTGNGAMNVQSKMDMLKIQNVYQIGKGIAKMKTAIALLVYFCLCLLLAGCYYIGCISHGLQP